MAKFHTLTLHKIIRETPDAVSLHFEIPEVLKEDFKFKAGQYITIEKNINGKNVRRAYSLCSTPQSGKLSVVVKEVKGGSFSVFANRELREGDDLEVLPPEGKFVLLPNADNNNTYLAFAAGSGITPVMSILKTVLDQEPQSKFLLVYGNRSPEDTIFIKELMDLQLAHHERFFLEFVYSRKQVAEYQFGRISKAIVNYFLKNKYKDLSPSAFYLCGPEPMIDEVKETLIENGVSKDKIHFELFSTAAEPVVIEGLQDGTTALTVMLDDEETTFVMSQNKTVLETVLEQDLDAPYSCQGGICSTCIARIKEGTAKMRKNQILTDEEIEEGLVLTCQAQPTSSVLKIDYDDV